LRPAFELAQVIERFAKEFAEQHHPNAYLRRTLSALERCRTAALGGHVDRCDQCGHIRISYNSCRNRHCPKCQNTQREAWIENRKQDLLPVPYFHVVFTIPERLNKFFLADPAGIYNLLFECVWNTLAQFSYSRLHAEMGMIAVLHTWGQNLTLHPHVHCIVPGGGLDYQGHWKQVRVSASGKVFLFDVKCLSRVFRGKFMERLKKSLPLDKSLVRELYKTDWVVYAKEPFGGAEQVVEYLGRYTHKVAISNHRIVTIGDDGVTFRWRDYKDGNKEKTMHLSGAEFLRRFCLHVLPARFVRIRHYGLLSTTKRDQLRKLQRSRGLFVSDVVEKKHWKDICREHLHYDPDLCPNCGKGKMITMERFFPERSPPLEKLVLKGILM
jgi:Putative transposase/Transposase zinc-binding domain